MKQLVLIIIFCNITILAGDKSTNMVTYFDLLPESILYYISNLISTKDEAIYFLLEKINLNSSEARNLAKRCILEQSYLDNTSVIKELNNLKQELIKIEKTIWQDNQELFINLLQSFIKIAELESMSNINLYITNQANIVKLRLINTDLEFWLNFLDKLNNFISQTKTYKRKQLKIYRLCNRIPIRCTFSIACGFAIMAILYYKTVLSPINQIQTCVSDHEDLDASKADMHQCGYGPILDCCTSKSSFNCDLYLLIIYPIALLVGSVISFLLFDKINKHIIKPKPLNKTYGQTIKLYQQRIINLQNQFN